MAIEEPAFDLVIKEGAFEIRNYAPAIAAEVTVAGERSEAVRSGFQLLAGYIFGRNKTRRTLAMTAPVSQTRSGDTIAMTAPVTESPSASGWTIRFTMPRGTSLDTLPEPNAPEVRLRPVAAVRQAVIRFSGRVTPDALEQRTAELLEAVRAHGLRATGAVSVAEYNPPWTLWFMRRNEVMVEVAG